MTILPPVRREVIVDAPPERAFAVFTDEIGRWWPMVGHSVYGATAAVGFDDGRIVERSAEGEQAVWGTVTKWDPGRVVSFTWHPGHDADRASAVTVTFHDRGERTLVVLEHTGWEIYADPEAARAEYHGGWVGVLDRYQKATTSMVGR
ncbi:MAG TPA: SRPBCC domain-containing protein [Acidimicrobiales bacterium]|jgi:uncharacterized protein YndB with AHSA1/START domain|nr:SRPBCC domain-containing protein [Acidimicrobiales bacterium]